MLRGDDIDWVSGSVECGLEVSGRGVNQAGDLEVVQGDCKACGLSREVAVGRGRWRRLVRGEG